MHPSTIYAIGAKEFKNSLRDRRVLGISLILAALALVISYFGFAPRGSTGFSHFDVTIVSLSSLVTYLVPIVALTLGFDAVIGEAEGKTLELLLTMPVTRLEFFLGKFLGLSATLTASIGSGFALAGAVIAMRAGPEHLAGYIIFIITAILLGLSFLSLALMVSAVAKERSKAVGLVIFLWFFFVLVFDLVLIGVLVGTEGNLSPGLFSLLLYLNPADLFRLVNLKSIESLRAAYGLATLARGGLFSTGLLYAGLIFWIIAPLGAGYLIFKKRSY